MLGIQFNKEYNIWELYELKIGECCDNICKTFIKGNPSLIKLLEDIETQEKG